MTGNRNQLKGPVLITGGTGCVGSNLAAALTERGIHCRVLVRDQSDLRGLTGIAVEKIGGDIRDIDSLTRAMHGCDVVFHTAAVVSFWKAKQRLMFDVNVSGTRNVVKAARATGIRRLVHTSSIAALGYRTNGELTDENTAYNWGESNGYKYSKHLAEQEVHSGIQDGLNAVIVNPTVVIGARDVYIHGGQFIRDMSLRRIPAYLAGGLNVVAVRDVVQGHLAAAEVGRCGERYLLGGHNFTHKAFFELLALTLGVPAPWIRCPVPLVKLTARIFDAVSVITGKEPWISSELVSGAGMLNWHSSEKAVRELGYSISPIESAIREAAEWYRSTGIL